MTERLAWDTDGADWPLREASRFVVADGMRWHVQQMGQGPDLVLLHGTGASTHSWRDLMPILAQRFRVTSMDLPGHAFSAMPPAAQMSLAGMSRLVRSLLSELAVEPALMVGHSAGAAVAVRMAIDGLARPQEIVSLGGALLPLGGVAGQIFSPMAKLLAANPLVARFFAWSAARDRAAVLRLLDGTGSTLDARGNALYGRLVRNTGHVEGALTMMAQWDLHELRPDLPRLSVPLHLVVGSRDGTIPPAQADEVKALVAGARITVLPGLGHLAHEQAPDRIDALIDWPVPSRTGRAAPSDGSAGRGAGAPIAAAHGAPAARYRRGAPHRPTRSRRPQGETA